MKQAWLWFCQKRGWDKVPKPYAMKNVQPFSWKDDDVKATSHERHLTPFLPLLCEASVFKNHSSLLTRSYTAVYGHVTAHVRGSRSPLWSIIMTLKHCGKRTLNHVGERILNYMKHFGGMLYHIFDPSCLVHAPHMHVILRTNTFQIFHIFREHPSGCDIQIWIDRCDKHSATVELHVPQMVPQLTQHCPQLNFATMHYEGREPCIGHAIVPCHQNLIRILWIHMLAPCNHEISACPHNNISIPVLAMTIAHHLEGANLECLCQVVPCVEKNNMETCHMD